MLVTTKKFVDAINEMKALAINSMFDEDMVKNMNEKDLEAMQLTLKIVDTTSELLIKEAEMMEEISKKLDNVLEKLEEES